MRIVEFPGLILFSPYDDPVPAKIHLNAIRADKFAYKLDLNNEKRTSKIEEILRPGSSYAIYWSVVRDTDEIMKKLTVSTRIISGAILRQTPPGA